MKITTLTDQIAVSGQIKAGDVAEIAAAGYTTLINNRPDGEEVGQTATAEIAAAAEAAGLTYHYLPVTAADFPGPDADTIQQLFDQSTGPVLAYCRTGTRCANLWVASRGATEQDQARQHARALGYDLAMSEAGNSGT
ncbi:MAG: TIGR01244 family sulfur transferase [Halioglobus sp.]